MDAAEIRHALTRARTLPEGGGRARCLEALARAARDGADRLAEAEVLLDLVRAYSAAGERDLTPSAFERLLLIYDENPGTVGGLSRSVHWYLKWMTHDQIDNPAVPLITVHHWLDELERRYRAAKYSLRPVLKLRSTLARDLGDHDTAARLRAKSMAAPRDAMTDCEACESHWAGRLSEVMGDDRDALERWAPVLNGRRRCAKEPHRVRARALLPLVRTGRIGEARAAHLTGYPLVRDRPGLRFAVAAHLEFCALTGNEARGLDILSDHASWLTEAGADTRSRLEFATGAGVLLRRLVELGHGDLPVAGRIAGSVLAELILEIDTLCSRYDTRNGTDAVGVAVRARLVAPPLVDHLPLGIRSVRPLRAIAADGMDPSDEAVQRAGRVGSAAVAELPLGIASARRLREIAVHGVELSAGAAQWAGRVGEPAASALPEQLPLGIGSVTPLRSVAANGANSSAAAGQWAARLGELAAARLTADPAGAERRLRHALKVGAEVLSPELLARLSSLLVTAISAQPGREAALADAAVTAAWRWEGLSEADAVHHTLVAARAWHRAGRHGEAAALFEQPLMLSSGSTPRAANCAESNDRPRYSPEQSLPGIDIPYPLSEIAVIRRQFGESLNALNRYRDAAAQFAEGARLVRDAPRHRELSAELVHAAAAALSLSGHDADALDAYQHAAELFGALGRVAARARCLRAAAWLEFWGESGAEEGLRTMRTLLADLQLREETSPELAAELEQTRRQLETMLDERGAE